MSICVDSKKCVSCGVCQEICPLDCIRMNDEHIPYVKYDKCWYCGSCQMDCPQGAIKITIPFLIR